MPYARLAMFPEGTTQQHEAIVEGLGDSHTNARGRLVFAAGETPEGFHIIQIWETREQLDQWVQDNLGKAMAAAGSRGYKHPPVITDFEVSEVRV